MNGGPAVVVNKGGFFAAVAKGLFSTIIVVLICGTALGLTGMYVFNSNVHLFTGQVSSIVHEVVTKLPDLQKALQPLLADALNDHRDWDYRDQLAIKTRFERGAKHEENGVVVLELKNNGKEAISFLTLRMTVEDDSDEAVCELPVFAASPIQIDGDWRGPLQPGQSRIIARRVRDVVGEPTISTELTDLRVFLHPGQSKSGSSAVAASTED